MRKARSSVAEAAGKSPRAAWARACVTSELVAGERRFSRAGGGGAGGYGEGCGEGWTGADDWAGGVSDGDDADGAAGMREVAQPAISSIAMIAPAGLLSERLS